jgi:hypothetical protein
MYGRVSFTELLLVAVMMVGALVAVAFPAGRICRRAGYPIWFGLLAVLPIVNLGLLWFVAFAKWPALSDSSGSDIPNA